MSPVEKSKIEWTDSTWSPVTGCREVSEGCEHCYAKTFAERFRGVPGHPYEQGFDLRLWPERLALPFRWRKARRVFVNSMSDLFFDARQVPDDFVARVFATMAATPQHTYQVLTKRPGRMASLLGDEAFPGEVAGHLFALAVGSDGRVDDALLERAYNPWEDWPLPNVWLGVSVESQRWARVRIPKLLQTPAAVRFLSLEPLLGPVDLSAWLTPIVPMAPEGAPKTWTGWTWPSWVPVEVRRQIEDFWREEWGRGPRAWLRDAVEQGAHPFGAAVDSPDGFAENAPLARGRYVHAWNNVGRLVREDGTFAYTSFSPREVRKQRPLDWVIVGGESGPGARPMNLAWARDLARQCHEAGVAVFVKQLGAHPYDSGNGNLPWLCRSAKGGDIDEFPADLRVREYPRGAGR